MTPLEIQLKTVQDKLQQLLRKQVALQKENLLLQQELTKHKTLAADQQKNMEDLKQQVDVLKISSGNWDDTDKKEFEKKLSSYIKEIDRCIGFLSE